VLPCCPVLCCPAIVRTETETETEKQTKQAQKRNRNETEAKAKGRTERESPGPERKAKREGERKGTSAHLPYSFLPSGIPAFVPFPFLYARKEKIFSYQKSPFSLPLGVFISVPTN
jgi:hypothetical protein